MVAQLASFVDDSDQGMVELLRTLVNMNSGTYFKPGVDAVGELLAERAADLGFQVRPHRQHDFGDHQLCLKPGSSPRLLFLAHFDTVFGSDTAAERPFEIRGDRAYGPGVLDMKGGIVVLLTALTALRTVAPEVYQAANLAILFNSDEEVLSPTSRGLVQAQAREAAGVCVLEPARPGGQYVTQRKGVGR